MAKAGIARTDLGRPRFPRGGHPSYRPPEPQPLRDRGMRETRAGSSVVRDALQALGAHRGPTRPEISPLWSGLRPVD